MMTNEFQLNLKFTNSLTGYSDQTTINYAKSMQVLDVYFELCEVDRTYDDFIWKCVHTLTGSNQTDTLSKLDTMYWDVHLKDTNMFYECINTTTIEPLNLSLNECPNLPTNADIVRHHKLDFDCFIGAEMRSFLVHPLPVKEQKKFFEEEMNITLERRNAINNARAHFNENNHSDNLNNFINAPVFISNKLSVNPVPEHQEYLNQLFDEIKKKHSWYYDLRKDLIEDFKSKYYGITDKEITEYLGEYS